jgi:hypothetical protein
MDAAETLLSLCVGLALSAACGFRVFIPLLVTNLAARAGHLELAAGFDWLASDAALVTFGAATVLEIGAYYIPWLDNVLDTIATPAAVVAGTVITASFVGDMSPMLRWTLAAIAGGGAAGLVQTATVVARGASTALTGGLGNPLLATAELGGSVVTSALVVLVPVAAVVLLMGLVGVSGWKLAHRKPVTAPPRLPADTGHAQG